MDPIDLINAAYASVLDDGDSDVAFMSLVEEAERSYQDQDARFEMTSEDLARTYSL